MSAAEPQSPAENGSTMPETSADTRDAKMTIEEGMKTVISGGIIGSESFSL